MSRAYLNDGFAWTRLYGFRNGAKHGNVLQEVLAEAFYACTHAHYYIMKVVMSILRGFGMWCAALVGRLESVPVGLWGWLFGITAIVILRNFFEGLSQRALNILDADNAVFFAHAWGFYRS